MPELNAALHDMRSLHNVGSCFRIASGAGISRLFLTGFTGAPPQPKIAKVALGAELEIPFERMDDEQALLDRIDGHFVVALEQSSDSVMVGALEPPNEVPVTLVMGGELLGLPGGLLTRADAVVEIPMAGAKESLNVSTAFAIVAYDLALKMGTVSSRNLKSRSPQAPVRDGVLTRGQTTGEVPGASHHRR